MSIAARHHAPDPPTGSWLGRESRIDDPPPLKDLLPNSGNLAPASAPERVLARDAPYLLRVLATTGFGPLLRLDAGLSADVDAIRRQLDPIRSRRSLAASYRREAFHDPFTRGVADLRSGGPATRLAYAVRWLELGPDRD